SAKGCWSSDRFRSGVPDLLRAGRGPVGDPAGRRDQAAAGTGHRGGEGAVGKLQGAQGARGARRRGVMVLTRSFKEIVQARLQRDPAFRQALLMEGVNCLLGGDVE